jgi:putative nucleotidyltransferase with HDIG domain
MSENVALPQAPWALRLLPPFPAVAHRLMALAGREDANINEISDLVKMDPTFSAELLRFANSPLFGVRGEIHSLAQAIMLVGMDRIKTMATLVALNRMVRSSVRMGALRKVWVHSLMTATIADEIASIARMDRDGAYTAGLLHNLGSLGLMSAYPDEYSRMLAVSDDFGFDLLQTERDLFEIDHCAAGAHIAQDWGFPNDLTTAIVAHHGDPVPGELSLSNLIKVSWRLADALGYAAFSPAKKWAWKDLIGLFPVRGSSWILQSPEAAQAELAHRLASAPL